MVEETATASHAENNNNNSSPQTEEVKTLQEGQTVCNNRDEKNKLCTGHLKLVLSGGSALTELLSQHQTLLRCQKCGQLYTGKPATQLRSV